MSTKPQEEVYDALLGKPPVTEKKRSTRARKNFKATNTEYTSVSSKMIAATSGAPTQTQEPLAKAPTYKKSIEDSKMRDKATVTITTEEAEPILAAVAVTKEEAPTHTVNVMASASTPTQATSNDAETIASLKKELAAKERELAAARREIEKLKKTIGGRPKKYGDEAAATVKAERDAGDTLVMIAARHSMSINTVRRLLEA